MVEWSKAEQYCQKYNGKLFKPNETSFDVPLFSEYKFNDDLWVAATYINIINVKSGSSGNSFIMCGMCNIETNCGITCLYKACGNQCRAVCKYILEPHKLILSDIPCTWTEASQWCSDHVSEFVDIIQNASSLFTQGYSDDICLWTRNVIQVQIQTEIAPPNEQGECGILHNGTLSFTSCTRHLHPLCERVAETTLETPRQYFSEESHSLILLNTKITSMTTTQSTNRIYAAISTPSTYGTLSDVNDITRSTTILLDEEHSSLLVAVGSTTSSNDLDESTQKSDTGVIIGGVIGSVVFLMLTTVLGIICVRKNLLQRTIRSKHESKSKTDTTHKSINRYQCHDVPVQTGLGLKPFAQYESQCEGFRSGTVKQTSESEKHDYMIDPDVSNVAYATVTKKENVNLRNSTYNTNYDSYDHLNDIRESGDDNVTENVYDTTNFKQRNECGSPPESMYDISGGHSRKRDESLGLYDRVKNTISNEYDTLSELSTKCNAPDDHI
ncbi:hypothetical protein ACJMK2_022201 [Sinanodonta woodiana]|uniref:C-type lectin domain-containing protein n=1 Tax=Sinanodonta woodiana TaxID=1069815 RepID=A0ABD3TIA3_SINWO